MQGKDRAERIAWAAGFFEGDGTFSSAAGYPMLAVSGIDFDPLCCFALSVEAGHVLGPYDRHDPRRWTKSPMYAVQIYREAVAAVAKLWPHLGEQKRASIIAVLERLGIEGAFCEIPRIDLAPRTRSALAWAAGFFDAEGCFSSTPRVGVCASITQTNREVLDRFRDAVGVGKIYGPYQTKPRDGYVRKPHYFYRAHGNELVQAILAMLWPWLGTTKRKQATDRLVWTSTCRNGHPKKPGHTGCGECTKAYWAARRARRVEEPAVPYLIDAA